MEFAIGIAIGAVIGLLFKNRRYQRPYSTHTETSSQRKEREADEIVTAILPTINHDK